ncbi:MAG: HupE/UreJ family protein [Flavobacteriales bacterium]|jgi:hydrogenase/urease accessory protein HupE|nr:HupE/UreJ family protein [Flavobacteriales bacterium]
MSDFGIYLLLGWEHITDFAGYDHMLFLLALALPYVYNKPFQILWPVTAFALGHSITLALSLLQGSVLPSSIIEFLIPLTITLTAMLNWKAGKPVSNPISFALAGVFGLIHGMGFSNYLRPMLPPDQDLWMRLLAFNLGLEAGQVLLIGIALPLLLFFKWLIGRYYIKLNIALSIAIVGVSLWMAYKNLPIQ